MTTKSRTRTILALLSALVLSFAIAACGDDEDDSTSPEETSSETSSTPHFVQKAVSGYGS